MIVVGEFDVLRLSRTPSHPAESGVVEGFVVDSIVHQEGLIPPALSQSQLCQLQKEVPVPIHHDVLRVYETGPLTVVGFGGDEILEQVDLAECRDEIMALLTQHDSKILAFDLTGVRYIPSGMLGLLASLRRIGIDVHLYNPSADVREVLQITRLCELFQVHELVM